MDNEPVSTESSPEPAPARKALVLVVTAVLLFALDLGTKVLALAQLEGKEPVRVLGGLAYLQIVRNPGAAFSIATGMTWVLALVAVGVVVAIIWILPRLRSTGWALGLGLVLAGALGNLTDRFFRAPGPLRGHVIDFVSLFGPNGEYWPVFNVADSSIVLGGILIVLLSLFGYEYDGRRSKDKKKAEVTAGD
ncbi:signal peptidase II [Actinocrispum wychmicini]|uniref:Lipoprotein signal peptidase n=1 Tax=Actinocrispum wychmicini TaxID=1213861 RepID=A0A4V2S6M4_9PSEU|nr:signal peptidase II [Actinocrispum wychmicini]TCO56650.1 signal peptidase II [Actinocrispum wychmicini]